MIVYGIRISYLSSKKLFGGGDDDDDRGSSSSSSSSSSYSEPVRYEAPKQSYSAPQQKVYYEESKPTYSGGGGGRSYSYVEESPVRRVEGVALLIPRLKMIFLVMMIKRT